MAARLLVVLALAAIAAAQSPSPAITVLPPPAPAPSTFIVKFRDSAMRGGQSALAQARSTLGSGFSSVVSYRTFTSDAFEAFLVVDTDSTTAATLRASSNVESVVADFMVYPAVLGMAPISGGPPTTSTGPSLRGRRLASRSGWNSALDRIDERDLPLDGLFNYFSSSNYTMDGSGIDVYVIDSGIRADHDEFGGRVEVSMGRNYVSDAQVYGSTNATDACYGHGTFVASQIGGSTVGVAPGVRLIPLRVFSCTGAGAYSAVLAATDYIVATAPTTGRRSIVNFSGGAAASSFYDALSDRLMAASAPLIDAAGNEGVSSCSRSPARSASSFTVGASDASDVWASFSNYGACVNITAVGVNNVGAWFTSSNAYAQGSGTSFSAPIVTGLAATILAASPAGTPWRTIVNGITNVGTSGVLTSLPAGTVNLIAYSAPVGGYDEVFPSATPSPSTTPSTSGSTSITPSVSPSASITPSTSWSGSNTPSTSATPTNSLSPASTPSWTATSTGTPASTRTRTPTDTPNPTVSRTRTRSATRTRSRTASRTSTP